MQSQKCSLHFPSTCSIKQAPHMVEDDRKFISVRLYKNTKKTYFRVLTYGSHAVPLTSSIIDQIRQLWVPY